MLCGETSTKKGVLEEALKDSEFQLILNANPSSRLRVEAGPKSCPKWIKMDQNGSKYGSKFVKQTKKNRMGRSELEGLTGFWHLLDVLDMLGHAWPCSFFFCHFSTWRATSLWISWSQLNHRHSLSFPNCAVAGEYCLRENPNGVDLNRNWDEKWDLGTEHSAEQSHGKRPFSEPLSNVEQLFNPKWLETRFLWEIWGDMERYGEIWGDTRKQVPWKVWSHIWSYICT